MARSPERPRAATHAVLSPGWLARHAAPAGNDPLDVQSPMGLCVVWLGGVRPRMVRVAVAGEPLSLALPPRARVLVARTDAAARRGCAEGGVRFDIADDGELPALLDGAVRLAAGLPDSTEKRASDFAEFLLRCPLVAHAGDPGDDAPPREDRGDQKADHAWLLEDGAEEPGSWPPADGALEPDQGGVRVLRAVPETDGADAAELSAFRRYAALARPLPYAGAPDPGAVAALLAERFPWAPEAVAVVRRELALRPPGGAAALAPLLLVGEPGGGKTAFARALLAALGVPSRVVPVADGGAVTVLAGAGRGWRAARPALALEMMRSEWTATVGLIVDDVDREPAHPAHPAHGSVAAWLLAVLEPSAASRFHDAFLQVECDLRTVTWVLTANDAETLPEALRDRCTEVHVPRPPPWALPGIARRMEGEVLEEAGWAAGSDAAQPALPGEVVQALVQEAAAEGDASSLRPLRRAVRAALAASRLGDDPTSAGRAEFWRHEVHRRSSRGRIGFLAR